MTTGATETATKYRHYSKPKDTAETVQTLIKYRHCRHYTEMTDTTQK